jgi:hypothetical protein
MEVRIDGRMTARIGRIYALSIKRCLLLDIVIRVELDAVLVTDIPRVRVYGAGVSQVSCEVATLLIQ